MFGIEKSYFLCNNADQIHNIISNGLLPFYSFIPESKGKCPKWAM